MIHTLQRRMVEEAADSRHRIHHLRMELELGEVHPHILAVVAVVGRMIRNFRRKSELQVQWE
jgi:hypothetical protein